MPEQPLSAPSNYDDHGPFDPDYLMRWAETYGDPEQWAKKAQSLHGRVERLEHGLRLIVRESEQFPDEDGIGAGTMARNLLNGH